MFKKLIFCAAAVSALVAVSANADDIDTKLQVCSACHGQNGDPINSTTPTIWGQQASYLYKELHDYHSGARANPIMASIAQGFSLPDLRQAADYFAAKTWPAKKQPASAPTAPEGTAVCKACHGQNFEGGAPAPRLAGLSYDYLISQMNAFADGQRTNNLDMPTFMKALSQGQRETIAHYLADL
jgi:cytochrome c553